MTSVERIVEYCELPAEIEPQASKVRDSKWPGKGEIKFEDVSMRYDATMPFVLQDVAFTIKAGQKVPHRKICR
jgi:ABC-type multidrug transport system fused ATPase/permease subunit